MLLRRPQKLVSCLTCFRCNWPTDDEAERRNVLLNIIFCDQRSVLECLTVSQTQGMFHGQVLRLKWKVVRDCVSVCVCVCVCVFVFVIQQDSE